MMPFQRGSGTGAKDCTRQRTGVAPRLVKSSGVQGQQRGIWGGGHTRDLRGAGETLGEDWALQEPHGFILGGEGNRVLPRPRYNFVSFQKDALGQKVPCLPGSLCSVGGDACPKVDDPHRLSPSRWYKRNSPTPRTCLNVKGLSKVYTA
ncbi:interleukin-1 beta [Platysternon megacephalum]|uniref:Interleukin-1 beta n=1 Tax=Platysternon megacephalum TaxID=55544 RepID=A0A4D9DNZ1_9SAUR|nr:interleukin-1 beta [Platysternon megacephalum]